MQFRSVITLITLTALSAPLATAAPTEGLDVSERAAEAGRLDVRQFYDGPCSNEECGVNRVNCRSTSKWCVPYPSVSEPQGCTCSSL
ncbi:hypothetical protein MGN70_013378 [Eutypa lata]|nr:hypothetical protein MGN70_013378 [Eutypa lata]